MGIQGLTKLLGDHAPGCIKEQNFNNYFGRKIAVDASMHIYQFLIVVGRQGDSLLSNEAGEVTSHLQGMFYRTARMLEAGEHACPFTYEGHAHVNSEAVNMSPSCATGQMPCQEAQHDPGHSTQHQQQELMLVTHDLMKHGHRLLQGKMSDHGLPELCPLEAKAWRSWLSGTTADAAHAPSSSQLHHNVTQSQQLMAVKECEASWKHKPQLSAPYAGPEHSRSTADGAHAPSR